ncbi:Homoserine O-succinyltransferase [Thioalkalivibrio nitratireducens DSM 14787]|uniref:Homoserine O-succinyltransferase n=1 Tax=Thioalkalivibrio nitratireducens (strain DSM 14787 / UNIQEM 213 / ALEN2) TaxID=1255043 RepID=METAS_THIND|nr:homoserine O-succinyltransferase [Thioalkalivibrio nitratireducens]L0E1U3.1 RecName: Full=Homoserine O-succinyltransferase; Short=HST; AltName: Full=Homoserine transsuccinylase; Short=HTS [Thioalkalivibrio nitratireducens DSM 14787]AGA35263.1 Homoserine O-succinyltransferase [Thioalkalivibrio nitratireducens DSM 14787]
MPLVAHSNLPTFERLRKEGGTVLPNDYALHQDIRALHIGLLNMMPDAALAATERQFFRLVGESNQIAQFYMHPFTLAELPRGPGGQAHVERYYETFDTIQREGLDALIITGANVSQPDLALEPFWEPLAEVVEWAWKNVTSTLCSCLTTHAVMQSRYGERRRHRGAKLWGVFDHRVVDRTHPLVAGVNTRFDVPHSRFNDVSREQFDRHRLKVLVESERAGVHLAVSEDGFRLVFFQGHPEYDSISLLKEYKREVLRFVNGEREEFPPLPERYLSPQAAAILEEHRERVEQARQRRVPAPELPEPLLVGRLDNTWHDSALAVVNNWIGNVYQFTNHDRRIPFRPGVDPNAPLNWSR